MPELQEDAPATHDIVKIDSKELLDCEVQEFVASVDNCAFAAGGYDRLSGKSSGAQPVKYRCAPGEFTVRNPWRFISNGPGPESVGVGYQLLLFLWVSNGSPSEPHEDGLA